MIDSTSHCHRSPTVRRWRVITAAAAAATVGVLSACRGTPNAFGPTAAAARQRADELFTGWQERFTRVERSHAYAQARVKLGHASFVPSRVYDDSSVWTKMVPDGPRTLSVAGHFVGDHYVYAMIPPAVDGLERLADSRHEIQLTKVGPDQFEWKTSVVQTIGSIAADDVDRVLGSMLSTAATTNQAELVAGSRVTFPHTAAVLSRLFSLDTLRAQPLGDGTATVRVSIGVHPDSIRTLYPAWAASLRKYGSSGKLRCVLHDAGSRPWLETQFAENRITIVLRATRDGHFAPFDGPARAMPDSLRLAVDVSSKAWIFSVGFTDLVSDFTIVRNAHERGWHLGFRREPRWHFPLLIGRLAKSSLRRPFAGDGAAYYMGVHDSAGTLSRFVRESRIDVQESTITRWLGGMGSGAMGDFTGPSEAQESAFFADVFAALRSDVDAALQAGPRTVAGRATGEAPAASPQADSGAR